MNKKVLVILGVLFLLFFCFFQITVQETILTKFSNNGITVTQRYSLKSFVRSIAVNAVIWGLPALLLHLIREPSRETRPLSAQR